MINKYALNDIELNYGLLLDTLLLLVIILNMYSHPLYLWDSKPVASINIGYHFKDQIMYLKTEEYLYIDTAVI